MNLRELVSGIRERVIRSDPRGPGSNDPAFLPLRNELAKLRSEYEQLYELRHLVGRMPAQPATLRARVGAPLVRAVQRMLFWYTPQIREVADASATFAGTACTAMEKQADLTATLAKRIDALTHRDPEFQQFNTALAEHLDRANREQVLAMEPAAAVTFVATHDRLVSAATFHLVREASRKLQPGGLLAIKGAEEHRFLLQYCGLLVIEQNADLLLARKA